MYIVSGQNKSQYMNCIYMYIHRFIQDLTVKQDEKLL